jgi:broad specificity phosphatase PhoE
MRVYIIRHGESETNRSGLWTGWLDAPLTEKGREEAERVGALLQKTEFDKIYVSDLSRARSTAEIALPGREYEICSALREINVGSIAGKPLNVINRDDKKLVDKDGYRIYGGESREEFSERVKAFMTLLEVQTCQNIAVFSHAGFVRKFLDTVLGIDVPRKNMLCKNCAMAVFEYSENTWMLHSWINVS